MSNSQFVCFRDGLPVHSVGRHGWRHSLGGRTGAIPKHMKHAPVVCPREEYERFCAPDTPLAEARAIAAKYRQEKS